MDPKGIEPLASTLQVSRSSQLSYGPKLQKTFCKTDSNRNLQRLCSDVLPLNYIVYCVTTKSLLYVFLYGLIFLAGLPSLLASYGRVITLLTKNFAHGAGFEPAMGLLRQINSLDRSANYGNPYFCGSGRIRTYSAEATDLQSVPPLQLRRTPIRPYYTIL